MHLIRFCDHKNVLNKLIIMPELFPGPIPNLIVRRGSEPSLNTLGCTTPTVARPEPLAASTNKKRWSSIYQLDQLPSNVSTLHVILAWFLRECR